MKLKSGDVINKAHELVILYTYGPHEDLGSFKPIKVEFDEKTRKLLYINW